MFSKKKLNFLIFLCFIPFIKIQSSDFPLPPSKHVVLHFDVNQTLIAFDSAGEKSVEDSINHILADKFSDYWEDGQKLPMTYSDYVYNVFLSGDCTDPELKKQRKSHLNNFCSYLNKNNHPLAKQVNKEYFQILEKIQSSPTKVFSSFYKLLNYLEENKISYSIHLRSFGNDFDEIIAEVEDYFGFPFFYERAFFNREQLHTSLGILSSKEQIYQYFSTKDNLIIRDDWRWWHSHGRKTEYGKPFYIKENDLDFVHIFIDDNVGSSWGDPENQGMINSIDVETGSAYPSKRLIEDKLIIKAETAEAIMDDEYYVRVLSEVLKKHNLDKYCTLSQKVE